MQVVFFPENLCARAPDILSCLYSWPDNQKTSIPEVIEAIRRNELIMIRPASESELKRAEAMIALFDIGVMIGQKVQVLLDQFPERVNGKLTAIRDALESVDEPVSLLDRGGLPNFADRPSV